MSDDVIHLHAIDPIIPESDPALDALYKQLVATAKQFGWSVPSREDFEAKYKAEITSKRQA